MEDAHDVRTAKIIADVEAQRHADHIRAGHMEGDLSLKDWVDRVASSTKQAASMARSADAQTQYEAWVEVAAIIVARAEQVLVAQEVLECDHAWPAELEHHSQCARCGLLYGEWSQVE